MATMMMNFRKIEFDKSVYRTLVISQETHAMLHTKTRQKINLKSERPNFLGK